MHSYFAILRSTAITHDNSNDPTKIMVESALVKYLQTRSSPVRPICVVEQGKIQDCSEIKQINTRASTGLVGHARANDVRTSMLWLPLHAGKPVYFIYNHRHEPCFVLIKGLAMLWARIDFLILTLYRA